MSFEVIFVFQQAPANGAKSVKAQLCSFMSSYLHLAKADMLVPSILQMPFQIP